MNPFFWINDENTIERRSAFDLVDTLSVTRLSMHTLQELNSSLCFVYKLGAHRISNSVYMIIFLRKSLLRRCGVFKLNQASWTLWRGSIYHLLLKPPHISLSKRSIKQTMSSKCKTLFFSDPAAPPLHWVLPKCPSKTFSPKRVGTPPEAAVFMSRFFIRVGETVSTAFLRMQLQSLFQLLQV